MANCFITKDYSQFKKTKGNRPISLSHVAKIKKAIAHKDLMLIGLSSTYLDAIKLIIVLVG